MLEAFEQFRGNLDRARDLVGLGQALQAQTTQAVDVSDLYRASIVLGVSALDHLVHEVTRLGMLEISAGARPETAPFLRFEISLHAVSQLRRDEPAWLDDEIRRQHGWLSFQHPEKLADALRHVSSERIWPALAESLQMPVQDAKAQLRLIVDRRNKIAHEADMDPTVPGFRWPISAEVAIEALDFSQALADAIRVLVA